MNGFSENFVVLDLETSGLDASTCGILEIGAIDAAGRRFYQRVALDRGVRVDWAALERNGIDALDLGRGVSVDTAICHLISWLRADGYLGRWIMGGKNPQFDYGFLRAHWPDDAPESLNELISRRCLDLHSVAYAGGMQAGWDMASDDFSTDDIYRRVGIEPEPNPHNALRGALHEMECFGHFLFGAESGMSAGKFESLMRSTAREYLLDVEGAAV